MVTDHEISDFKRLCSVIGKDPLIVQGAGGNASWKNQDKIWIKSSGTGCDAERKPIFTELKIPKNRVI